MEEEMEGDEKDVPRLGYWERGWKAAEGGWGSRVRIFGICPHVSKFGFT
jgi:hypothetical protein